MGGLVLPAVQFLPAFQPPQQLRTVPFLLFIPGLIGFQILYQFLCTPPLSALFFHYYTQHTYSCPQKNQTGKFPA